MHADKNAIFNAICLYHISTNESKYFQNGSGGDPIASMKNSTDIAHMKDDLRYIPKIPYIKVFAQL